MENSKEQIIKITRERIPESNIIISKYLFAFAVLCFAMLLLFEFGLLASKGTFIHATFVATPVFFIIASLCCFFRKGKGVVFQYLFILLLTVFWLELEMMSGYKCKLLLSILIIISMRYYSRKFVVFTYIMCVLAMLASVFCNAYLYAETEFIDLNVVSLDGYYNLTLDGFLYNNIIDLQPSPQILVRNGMRLTFLPNFIFLTVITVMAIRFMRNNLRNIVRAEELATQEANQRVILSDMKTKMMLSQIKPHFIYNTLTTISYFCSEDPKKAEDLTNRFAEYLRNNISSLSENKVMTFSKELAAIKNYIEIEKYRFEERVQIEYDIQAEDFDVPVLSIQPIVENAVKHGICKKKEGGTIWLSTREEENEYVIVVKDNGVGFTLEDIESDGQEHVGVKNITARIENIGGKITMESKKNVGTTVTIRLPKAE